MVDTSAIADQLINVVLMIIIPLLVIGVAVFVGFFLKNLKKYKQFIVYIFEKDAFGNVKLSVDEAGMFVDKKTGNKRLFLKRNKVGLSTDNVPVVTKSKGASAIFLFKKGTKNFAYLNMNVDDSNFVISVTEEDVNWALQDYEGVKKRLQHPLLQYLPIIGVVAAGLIIIIMVFVVMNKFGVFADMVSTAKELMATNLEIAKMLNQSAHGVVPTG